MSSPLYFGAADKFATYYPNVEKSSCPFIEGATISTLLPKETVLLRTVYALTASVLLMTGHKFAIGSVALSSSVSLTVMALRSMIYEMKYTPGGLIAGGIGALTFVTPLKLIPQYTSITAVAYGIFGLWTAYTHLYKSEDPLIQAFHQIAGGEDKFKKIPKIEFDESKTLVEELNGLSLSDLAPINQGVFKGRQVVIVKAAHCENKTDVKIRAFVERFSPFDLQPFFSVLPSQVDRYLALLLQAIPSAFQNVSYPDTIRLLLQERQQPSDKKVYFHSGIKSEYGNEFFAQLKSR